MKRQIHLRATLVPLLLLAAAPLRAALPGFDFTAPGVAGKWKAEHGISALKPTGEGLEIAIAGEDPYLSGPAVDLPAGVPLWLEMALDAGHTGTGQVFFYPSGGQATEGASVKFRVAKAGRQTVRMPLPALGPRTVFRVDPPGDGGTVTLSSIRFSERRTPAAPAWPKPAAPALDASAPSVRSGAMELRHAPRRWGAFELRVDGRPMAIGNGRPLIGYTSRGATQWIDVAAVARAAVEPHGEGLRATASFTDEDGAAWTLDRRFEPDGEGGIAVTTSVRVSKARAVVFLPMLAVFPGAGSFGPARKQALFAGLEYLDGDEPSSSEKDVTGPAAVRTVPDAVKVTFPLMAVSDGGRFVALSWKPDPRFSALFDSPDRIFGSGGHVFGAIFPGSNGLNREDGSLLPYEGETLAADRPLVLRATLQGGPGTSVVPAIQAYVRGHPLPPVPAHDGWDAYARVAAAGWLSSGIREGDRYRHAYPGNFAPQLAADAAMWIDYLAGQTADAALSRRLMEAAKATIARVPADQVNSSLVGHVRLPAPALVYGVAARNAEAARREGFRILAGFQPDGSVLYAPPAEGEDLARTNGSREVNGLTAAHVERLLQAALVSGDPALKREGLRLLRALEKWDGSAPRGAQSWEVPLHTPDILAAAHMVRAFTMGYEMTGEPGYLERARYWAWTGVPFVYLAPVTEPVGPYATIAVYGASNYVAPNWIGLPVQWCGLVYAAALNRLARHDADGPWRRLADGIAASGVQQTGPLDADRTRAGLLPDSFDLRAQLRNDPHINPATLLAAVTPLYRRPAVYDDAVLRNGWTVHAPGAIEMLEHGADRARFRVAGWPRNAYEVLVSGVFSTPSVRVNGRPVPLAAPHAWDGKSGILVVRVSGQPEIEITRDD